MRKKNSLQRIFAFTNECKVKMLIAISFAVVGVLCGMAPYFSLAGKLKAMSVDTVEKLEQPLAHILPEITANVFTPICITVLLFVLDWRHG